MRRSPTDRTQLSAVLLSTVLAVSIIGAVAFLPVAAEHPDDTTDYTGQAYFEISEVSQSDHHPGQDEGSMQYFAGGSEAFEDQGAEEGVYIDYIIIDSFYDGEQWIDYSDCTTDNTAAFGIDRGNDNEGTNYDEDLVAKQKEADFRDDGITVEFYNFDDLGGDPPYMAPEDAIVAEQGENSAGGGCLSVTEEPGWYRIQGFLNGTVADNGEGEQPSEDAEDVSVAVESTWFYVCDCESEEEAREELGDPPEDDSDASADGEGGASSDDDGGDDGGDSDATETPSDDEGTPTDDGGDTATETEGGGDGDTSTDEGGEDNETGEGDAGAGNETGDDGAGNQSDAGEDNETGGDAVGQDAEEGTPTADDGPGFGALVALLALFGSALLLNRRR